MNRCTVCKLERDRIVPLSETCADLVCEECANELLDFFEVAVEACREAYRLFLRKHFCGEV